MGGVDHHDQQVIWTKKKAVKTWKKRAFNIISRMLLNSYIMYTQNTSDRKKLKHTEFNLSVTASLSEEYVNNNKSPGVQKLPQ